MKILLVNPPSPKNYYNKEVYLPSSLLYIAAVVEKNGDEAKILDLKAPRYSADIDRDKLFLSVIADFKPDIIGMGCLFSGNFPELLKLSELSKKHYPNIPIIAGGIHLTIYAKEILENCPSLDYIVLGEGEETVIQFMNGYKNNRAFKTIDGFVYRENNTVIYNPKTRYIADMDTIPFPSYEQIDIKDYYVDTAQWHNPKNLPINTSIPIITSRSCPQRCRFCSMFLVMGPKWRARSAKNVVDEIAHVYSTYNHRHFSFLDDNMSFNKQRTIDICNDIRKRGLNIQFETPNGLSLNTLDEEVLDALVSAGMIRTYLAIESGSEYIRNAVMKKNLKTEKILEVSHLVKKYTTLNVAAFFIIGMPEETLQTLDETYELIKKIDVDRVFIMNLVPFPGTPVFEQAIRDKLLINPSDKPLYMSDNRYFTNYETYFLKPYNLTIDDMVRFREKVNTLACVKK